MSRVFFITPKSHQGQQYLYDPLKFIGEGSYSAAFQVYLLSNDDTPRIKTISDLKQESKSVSLVMKLSKSSLPSQQRARICHEAQLLQRVQHHPNFVQYVDHSLHTSSPYLITEFIPHTLESLLLQGQLDQPKIWDYLLQIPTVLTTFKNVNIAHCDLKCSNIGYNQKTKTIQILDFGSCLPYAHYNLIRIEQRKKSSYYPPEFERGILTPTSDTYMAGRALEQMLTGCTEDNVQATLENIEKVHQHVLPPSFKEIITGMLNSNPELRPPVSILKNMINKAWEEMNGKEYFQPLQYDSIRIDTSLSWLFDSPFST